MLLTQSPSSMLPGGYDPRLEDNMLTLYSLIDRAKAHSLTYNVITSSDVKIPPLNTTKHNPHITFLLNFTTTQRTALLSDSSTKALLYTPANEHFGIGPVEAMSCGVPVLACNSGGPTESVVDQPLEERTGWLRAPDPETWASALVDILSMSKEERQQLSQRAQARARALFGMEAMAGGLESALVEASAMGDVQLVPAPWWVMFVGFIVAYVFGSWLFAPAAP